MIMVLLNTCPDNNKVIQSLCKHIVTLLHVYSFISRLILLYLDLHAYVERNVFDFSLRISFLPFFHCVPLLHGHLQIILSLKLMVIRVVAL